MKSTLLKTVILCSLYSMSCFATEWNFLSVNGYGAIGGAYQENENILYRDSFLMFEQE